MATAWVPPSSPGTRCSSSRCWKSAPSDGLLLQIVLCRDDFGHLRLHRLVERRPADPPLLITRGDNLTRCDPPRRPDQVLGRVVMVQRSWARRLVRLAQALPFAWMVPFPAKL